jgi:hypothetical protein
MKKYFFSLFWKERSNILKGLKEVFNQKIKKPPGVSGMESPGGFLSSQAFF